MMKTGIITFHFVNNFGGVLQAYALSHILAEECETESVVVDYRNRFITFTDAIRMFPVTKNPKEFISGLSTMHMRRKRSELFCRFVQENMALTKTYHSIHELRCDPPDCTRFICGSDQIWNPIITGGIDSAYYLDFAPKEAKRISYAPSFGITSIPQKFAQKIQAMLLKFDGLSVREQESVKIIKTLTGKEAEALIDPTLLISSEQWMKVAKKTRTPEKYILLYIMQNDANIYEYVKKIKENFRLPVVAISRYGYHPSVVDQVLVDIGPAEFLGLFQNADVVCTNSYHGLIFSLIFEKTLFLVPSKNFSSRMSSLLQLLKIDVGDHLNRSDLYCVKYQPTKVRNIVEIEREKALLYLRHNLWGQPRADHFDGEERCND